MFSLLVGFILILLFAALIFFLIGKLRIFSKVGNLAANSTDIFKEKEENKTKREND